MFSISAAIVFWQRVVGQRLRHVLSKSVRFQPSLRATSPSRFVAVLALNPACLYFGTPLFVS